MAFHHHHLSIPLLLLLLLLLPSATSTAISLPIFKTTDRNRNQYHTNLLIGTPPVPFTLTLDVNNAHTWLACDRRNYTHSSTYSPTLPHSSDCKAFSDDGFSISCSDTPVPTPSCNPNQCAIVAINPNLAKLALAGLLRDSATLKTPGVTTLPGLPFACALNEDQNKTQGWDSIFREMSEVSDGILSLSRKPASIQYQISSTFNVSTKFAICLPSSTDSDLDGGVYFGAGPYSVSSSMAYLPLQLSPNRSQSQTLDYADPAYGFYAKIASIEIDGAPVAFNSSLLSIDDSTGDGGTLVSPIAPYGQLRSEIYAPFVELYVEKARARNVKTVRSPRKEFGACFDPNSIRYDRKTGSGLPVIDLVSERGVKWRILGSNSVVVVRGASCLAFVEGKPYQGKPELRLEGFPAVVIGGMQMEDNLVEFDEENSRLGVTSSLLRIGTSCAKFKGL